MAGSMVVSVLGLQWTFSVWSLVLGGHAGSVHCQFWYADHHT